MNKIQKKQMNEIASKGFTAWRNYDMMLERVANGDINIEYIVRVMEDLDTAHKQAIEIERRDLLEREIIS